MAADRASIGAEVFEGTQDTFLFEAVRKALSDFYVGSPAITALRSAAIPPSMIKPRNSPTRSFSARGEGG